MKLFFNLSKLKDSTTFKHDAPLISGVQTGMMIFLVLSSLTVFSGVRSHLIEYLENSFLLWRWLVYLGAYIFGSFAPDYINTVLCAYVVSAILRKDYSKESKILMVFCSVLIAGLTYYSFSMSQNSAVVLGNDIETENKQNDSEALTRIDTTLNNKLAAIETAYAANYSRINEPFKNQLDNIAATYDNQVKIFESQIEAITRNETKDNYLYAAKQKKPLAAKIQALEAAKLAAIAPILEKQQKALDELTKQKSLQIESAEQFHKSDRQRTRAATDGHNRQVKHTSTIFSDLFAKLAGYAIFALLLLTAIRGVLFHRNGIEPKPILSNFDFSASWMIEVLSYPVAWLRHHSVNKVRQWYERLPEIKQPVVERNIYDGESLEQDIVQPEPEEMEIPEQIPVEIPTGTQRNKKAKSNISASIPVTATSNGTHEKKTVSQYSHENSKTHGSGTHEIEITSSKKSTHETSDQEQKIKHIGKDGKEYWYNKKQVEGKIKKYAANVREWTKRANQKKATNRDKAALENNKGLLNYWQSRINEFK